MKRPKVSVIIIVYNAEQYIERCLRSLFEQTLDDIEFIFVDDKTPDRSFEILEKILTEYPERKEQVRIIRLPVNSGQAAARTAGMKAASGEYQIHCDPDDKVEKNAYETMYLKARQSEADIVLCRACVHRNGKEELAGITFEGTGLECLLENRYGGALWSKMISSEMIRNNGIYPFKGINNGEDLNVSIRAFLKADKVTSVDKPLYHYNRDNYKSITNASKKENFFRYIVPNIEKISGYMENVEDARKSFFLDRLKFLAKYDYLSYILLSEEDIKEWIRLWPETHKSIHRIKDLSLFTRLLLPFFIKSAAGLILWVRLKNSFFSNG